MEIKEPQPLVPGGSYPLMSDEDLENRFKQHNPATPAIAATHNHYREACLELAFRIRELVPPGREQALAITNLEEVMFWGNAGIARKSN